ncbi:MAG: hypothetical protein O6942_03875 [Bacteroidetes bacterium]|nr:hypothetical protein [Bacteroidota bacterium]
MHALPWSGKEIASARLHRGGVRVRFEQKSDAVILWLPDWPVELIDEVVELWMRKRTLWVGATRSVGTDKPQSSVLRVRPLLNVQSRFKHRTNPDSNRNSYSELVEGNTHRSSDTGPECNSDSTRIGLVFFDVFSV